MNTFTFDNAKKICKYYKFLVGSELVEGFNIDYVCIAPANNNQFSSFLANLAQSDDAIYSLSVSGFDRDAVRIIAVSQDSFGGNVLYWDIDRYLSENKLLKCYDNSGRFIAPKSK